MRNRRNRMFDTRTQREVDTQGYLVLAGMFAGITAACFFAWLCAVLSNGSPFEQTALGYLTSASGIATLCIGVFAEVLGRSS